MTESRTTFKREGFPGQKLLVVPRSIVRTALAAPVTGQLVVTDCGYFPHASHHGRVRPSGAGQAILIICSGGQGWAEIDGVSHVVRRRQALVIPRRTVHAYGADRDDPWTIWWVHLDGALVPDLLAASGATAARPVLDIPSATPYTTLITEVIDALEADHTLPSLLTASGAAVHLLTTLAGASRGSHIDDPVERTKAILATELSLPLSIEQLAAAVSLSPSHLTALFKRRTGYAPMQYRTLLRMQRAQVLLDTSDKPISVIAREVGYDDAAYFSRRFTALYEQGPRSYRHTAKG